MKKTQKYCYLDPQFPPEIFLFYIPLFANDIPYNLVAVDFSCRSERGIIGSVKKINKEYNKGNNEKPAEMSDMILYYPLTFQRKILLKKEQWRDYDQDCAKTYDMLRARAFFKVIKSPQTYEVLVVARTIDKKGICSLAPDFPFPKPVSDETLENYAYNSYSVIIPEAKYAAIYSIGNALNLNWKTGETGIKPPITREQEMMN